MSICTALCDRLCAQESASNQACSDAAIISLSPLTSHLAFSCHQQVLLLFLQLLFFIMHLMHYLDASGNRVYTLKVSDFCALIVFSPWPFSHNINHNTIILSRLLQKQTPEGSVTESAHPARFSPDDKFSRHRVACKKRFGIYLPNTTMKPM